MTTHMPSDIKLHTRSQQLELRYPAEHFLLPAEYLRVFSPSAEVRGHGQGQATLQTGKQGVRIIDVTPVGHYALKIAFDDGHDSGLYTWDYLYTLAAEQPQRWQAYLDELAAAGATRRSGLIGRWQP